MLEGLEDHNWSELSTAYGPAVGVPRDIRNLTASHPADWSGAMFALHATVLHQGSICSATAAVVPFLIELLTYPTIRCRGHLLRFLGNIVGATYKDMLRGFYGQEIWDVDTFLQTLRRFCKEEVEPDEDSEWDLLVYILKDLEEDVQTEEGRDKHQQRLADEYRAKEAVWDGLDIYLDLLSHPDVRLRIGIPYLFGQLAQGAFSAIPANLANTAPWQVMSQAMQQRLTREHNDLVIASLVFGLNALCEQQPGNLNAIHKLRQSEPPPPVRLAVNWCLSDRGYTLPAEEIEFLADTLLHYIESDRVFDAPMPGIEWRYHPKKRLLYQHQVEQVEEGDYPDPADNGASEDIEFPWEIAHPSNWPRMRTITCLCRLGAEHLPAIQASLLAMLETANQYHDTVPILEYLFAPDTLPEDATLNDLSLTQQLALRALYNNDNAWTNTERRDCLFAYNLWELGVPQEYELWANLGETDKS